MILLYFTIIIHYFCGFSNANFVSSGPRSLPINEQSLQILLKESLVVEAAVLTLPAIGTKKRDIFSSIYPDALPPPLRSRKLTLGQLQPDGVGFLRREVIWRGEGLRKMIKCLFSQNFCCVAMILLLSLGRITTQQYLYFSFCTFFFKNETAAEKNILPQKKSSTRAGLVGSCTGKFEGCMMI